jgi:hypothetical protein
LTFLSSIFIQFATMRQQMGMNQEGQPDPNNENNSNQDPNKPEPAP